MLCVEHPYTRAGRPRIGAGLPLRCPALHAPSSCKPASAQHNIEYYLNRKLKISEQVYLRATTVT